MIRRLGKEGLIDGLPAKEGILARDTLGNGDVSAQPKATQLRGERGRALLLCGVALEPCPPTRDSCICTWQPGYSWRPSTWRCCLLVLQPELAVREGSD